MSYARRVEQSARSRGILTQLERLVPLPRIVVCSSCKRASCSQGVFPCRTPTGALTISLDAARVYDREATWWWSAEFAEMAQRRNA